MYLTVQTLLNDPEIVRAVIDRVQALRLDTIFWKKHLDFEETRSRTFKTYLGTVTGVTLSLQRIPASHETAKPDNSKQKKKI